MPKIPTFQAKGSIEQLQGVTTNIQMGLNNTLASALAPVTQAVVDYQVKENTAQNQAEALRLENDFITDMQDVQQTIKTDPKYALNKDAANVYLKTQSETFIKKYKALATNGNVQDKFSNYALAETQKSIFKTDSLISNNIIADLNNGYSKQKENLMKTAFMDKNIDMATLKLDLEKLAIDTYSTQVSPPELDKLLATIPRQIDMMVGLENVSQAPSKTFELLKDINYLPSITIEQRKDLQEKAKAILRPQIRVEFENYITAVEAGKEPPRFDTKNINEIFTEPQAQKIMVVKEMADNNANTIKFFHTLTNDDIDINLKTAIEENEASLSGDLAIASNKFLSETVENIKSNRQDNPVKYILDTNPDIENEVIDVSNMSPSFQAPNITDTSAMNEGQLNVTERIVQEQIKLGIKNIKVMTNEMSQSFVADYNEASKLSDGDKLNAMILSLATNYGDNEGLAIQQLKADGLPFGATVAAGLANSNLAEIALSFDTEDEKKQIKEYLKTNQIKIDEMKEEITDGVSEFMELVLKNTPLDSSKSLTKTNEIKEFLTFVAAQKMIGNPDMSQSDAIQFATDSWNNNFVLTDTYYIGKQQGEKTLNLNETNRIQDTTDLLRTYYLDELDVVAFQSNSEDDPVVLSNKMRSQMSINGEWRNTADGEGVIFGIVLDNGFAPVINNKGEQIIFKFDDQSGLVPGTDIVIDFDVGFNEPESTPATMLIDTFEKANQLARDEGITYEEAIEKIRKPEIPNIEFDDGKKNSKKPLDIFEDENSQPRFVGLNNNRIDGFETVDIEYISKEEGDNVLDGYTLPPEQFSKSGVTVATGVDLGARNLNDLKGLDLKIIEKLKPYLGLKGKNAKKQLDLIPLKLSEKESNTLNKFIQKKILTKLKTKWNNDSKIKFNKLSTEQATVLASVAFQYGSSFKRTNGTQMNFYKLALNNDWQGVYDELMDFKDKSESVNKRHKRAAKILKKYLNKQEGIIEV